MKPKTYKQRKPSDSNLTKGPVVPLSAPGQSPFPPAWVWLVDEAIPTLVKKKYSPRESWKDKPFTKDDAIFFFKGIEGLSDLFTDERPKGMPSYFQHEKYRSSYLLYFVPLQAAKFLSLYRMHPQAIEAALHHGMKQGVLRIADLGAGPGTASISFLLLLLTLKLAPGQELPPVELEWFDTNADTMEDGREIVEQLSNSFPKLRGKVTIKTHVLPWWKAPAQVAGELSMTFIGHVFNESTAPQNEFETFWDALFSRVSGGGLLMVEPAARRSSQILSQFRDDFFENGLFDRSPTRIWGPCLHAQACPLAHGRDWCHFSVPTYIPGKWFKGFSQALGSERQWLKFSYIWMASSAYPSPEPDPMLRRVISDSLSQGPTATFLICEPEVPGRHSIPASAGVCRGDLVKKQAER
jgi:hypothetical protein